MVEQEFKVGQALHPWTENRCECGTKYYITRTEGRVCQKVDEACIDNSKLMLKLSEFQSKRDSLKFDNRQLAAKNKQLKRTLDVYKALQIPVCADKPRIRCKVKE